MKMLRTIVVEDERLPRLSLLAKLDELSHTVEVVDSCADYDSARMSILRHRPDLLLLDIQLQGRDSMQLLDELKQTITLPYVIFTKFQLLAKVSIKLLIHKSSHVFRPNNV